MIHHKHHACGMTASAHATTDAMGHMHDREAAIRGLQMHQP